MSDKKLEVEVVEAKTEDKGVEPVVVTEENLNEYADKIVSDTSELPLATSLMEVIDNQQNGKAVKITDKNVIASIVDQSLASGAFDHYVIVSALVNTIEEVVVTGESLQLKYREDAQYFTPNDQNPVDGTVH